MRINTFPYFFIKHATSDRKILTDEFVPGSCTRKPLGPFGPAAYSNVNGSYIMRQQQTAASSMVYNNKGLFLSPMFCHLRLLQLHVSLCWDPGWWDSPHLGHESLVAEGERAWAEPGDGS